MKMQQSSTSLIVMAALLGAGVLFGCNTPVEMPPEQVSSVEQGLCSADTHCEFYTDDSHAELCGERDMCISCSSANSQWGCVSSPYRQCWNMGSCSTKFCWVCNGIACDWVPCI